MKNLLSSKRSYVFSLFFLLCFAISAFSQVPISITGTVSDSANKTPLGGVTVAVKGGRTVVTDGKGQYSVRASRGQTIVFSFIGYGSQQIPVGTSSSINVSLGTGGRLMEDVIVIGYGSQNRKSVTGSVAKIDASEFKQAVVSTVDQALQGRAAGVQVTSASGEPGATVVVRIRGANSLSSDNQPLYVIDGFAMPPFTEAAAPNTYGSYSSNGLYGLNPNDIESIEVLKDASATAIYGSRGANGVVLITTKKGKSGEGVIEIINKTAFGTISNPYQMMNSYEFGTLKNQIYMAANQTAPFNLDSIPTIGNTDWLKLISRTGFRQENSVNYRGGSGKTNYFLSGTYLTDQGVLKGSDNKRGSVRFNLNTSFRSWYDARLQFSATRARLTRAITESHGFPAVAGPLFDALRAAPLHQNNNLPGDIPDVSAGVGLSGYAFINPLQELLDKTDLTFNDQVLANMENIFYLTSNKNLELHALIGSSLQNSQRQIALPPWLGSARSFNGLVTQSQAKTQSFNSTVYLMHKLNAGPHSLVSTAGVEYTAITLDQFDATGKGINFPSIALYAVQSAQNQNADSYKEENVIQSGFIRENYSFANKYLLSLSVRADGASKFAANNKWATFPAVAFAWNADQEDFIKNIKAIDFAKVRVSYGLTGSQSLPAYRSTRQYSAGTYELGNTPGGINPVSILLVTQPNNPDLKWETTSQFDAGMDLSFKKGSVTLTADYYDKTTKDLLQFLPVPSQSGYGGIWANTGSIRNRGFEFNLGLRPIVLHNFSWSTNIVFSHNKTTVIDLGKFDPKSQGLSSLGGNLLGGGASILIPGQEVGLFYGYKVTGLYQKGDFDAEGHAKVAIPQNTTDNFEGRQRFADINNSGVINDSDKVIIGHAQPKFTLGWNNNFTYKNWNLNLFFNGSFGNDILNVSGSYLRTGILNFSGVSFNQTKDWYDHRYTPEHPTNDPKYPAVQPQPNGGNTAFGDATSAMIEDGTYMRLKSATISYSPKFKTKAIAGLTIFVTATNIFTLTKYTGFDPEVSSYGTDIRLQGIDYAAYPNYKNYTIGLDINL